MVVALGFIGFGLKLCQNCPILRLYFTFFAYGGTL